MTTKHFLFGGFILMVLAQLYVPTKMILDREKVITEGNTFRFRTEPIDPTDPFRGKYVRLNFERLEVDTSQITGWQYDDEIYVTFMSDSSGYARVKRISTTVPSNSKDYIKSKITQWQRRSKYFYVDIPFDRFYMEESKARPAELAFNEMRRDTSTSSYALVKIMDGQYVLQDALIDGIPLKEVAERRKEKAEN